LFEEVYYGFLYRRYHSSLVENQKYEPFTKNFCKLFRKLKGFEQLAKSRDLAVRIFGLKKELSMKSLLEKNEYRLIDAYLEALADAKLNPAYTDEVIPDILLRINAQCSATNLSKRLELNSIGVSEVRLDPIRQFKTENNVYEVITGETTDTLIIQDAPPAYFEYKMPDIHALKKQKNSRRIYQRQIQ